MTPKEKAADLIDKFLDYSWADHGLKDIEYFKSLRNNAKQYALIHVDELLKLKLVQPMMMYGMHYVIIDDFYSQVKEEIQKL